MLDKRPDFENDKIIGKNNELHLQIRNSVFI